MHLPRYHYKINPGFLDFEFTSEGPKGKIRKIIRFKLIGNSVYNLAFGDFDEFTGKINDLIVTDNDDSRKVLATVAYAVYDFTNHFPGALIIAKGSTPARTRLYRMGINNYWKEISTDFEVYGLNDSSWEKFAAGHGYDAFLIRRK